MIAVAPVLEDAAPFPTTFWLTCPHLTESIHGLESAGVHRELAALAADDPAFAARTLAADRAYRAARAAEGRGIDPCPQVGTAGQTDALAVKCLHARVAAVLAGIDDPVGEAVLARLQGDGTPPDCADARCAVVVAAS